jgi:hypothetical protein
MFVDTVDRLKIEKEVNFKIDVTAPNYVISFNQINNMLPFSSADIEQLIHDEFYLSIFYPPSLVDNPSLCGVDFVGVKKNHGCLEFIWAEQNSCSVFSRFVMLSGNVKDITGVIYNHGEIGNIETSGDAMKTCSDICGKMLRFITTILSGKTFLAAKSVNQKKIKTGKKKGKYFPITRIYLDKAAAIGGGVSVNSVDWVKASHVRGHWRKINGLAVGKNYKGVYSELGRTWVMPHVRNDHLQLMPSKRILATTN